MKLEDAWIDKDEASPIYKLYEDKLGGDVTFINTESPIKKKKSGTRRTASV